MNSTACNETHLSETHKAAVYLIACALNGVRPDKSVTAAIDHKSLYEFADSQKIDALLGSVLGQCDCGEMTDRWKDAYNRSIRKNILFDAERAKVFSLLEENGIWYVPLKGILLKDLYPVYGTRQMSDNDILFDPAYAAVVKDLFTGLGYECLSYMESNHDAYFKKPYFNFEMHLSLFQKFSPYHEFDVRIKNRLLKDEDTSCGCHFSKEDCYIYIYLHFAKHLHHFGTGIRSLTDLYLYRLCYPDLDSSYISEELSRFDLAQEEQFIQKLVRKIFSSPDPDLLSSLDPEDEAFLLQFLENGTYGSMENFLKSSLDQYSESSGVSRKLHYLKDRLFPDIEEKLSFYPAFFSRHRWARPFFFIYRFFNRLIVNRKTIWAEIKIIFKIQ